MEYEEGQKCPECKEGLLQFRPENCSCHIHPPCSACVDAELQCNNCHLWIEEARIPQHPMPLFGDELINKYRDIK